MFSKICFSVDKKVYKPIFVRKKGNEMLRKLKNNSKVYYYDLAQFCFGYLIFLKATSKQQQSRFISSDEQKSFHLPFVNSVATDKQKCQKLKGGVSNSL